MANRRFIDFPIASTVGDSDIILIWQSGANKQTTKATFLSGLPENLDELNDVAISGLTNGQILRYNSVTGKWENTDQGNLDLNDLNDVSIVSPSNGQVLVYNSSTSKWENSSGGYVPYTGAVTTVNLGAQTIQAGQFVKAGGTAAQFLKADGSVDSTAYGTGSVTSVALTMPSAFNVANSPITTAGTLAVTGAGTVGQYIRGDGSLADFPQASGGGSSVSYYLNGSISQGTIGGVAYKELNKVPILGAGTDFTINADGYIASFLTDAGDPNLLEIPGGNWNFETYFSASSSGGSPSFYVELYKYDGTTFTLIASSSSSPELIAFGTNLNPYFSTLAVPTTTLALTDRLAIRYYVTHSGRTITLHTENNHLCQVVTTFTTGLTSLNGLTAQVQNLAVGTSGTDFNIASAIATHTFNLPTASATNRGALSSADWSTFNNKQNALGYVPVPETRTITINGVSQDLSANRTYNVGTVTSVGLSSATSGVTIGGSPVTGVGAFTLAIATASGSQNGLLSSTDWTTFNSKQNALTNPVTGTGTTNYLPKFTGASTIGNSQIYDTGSEVRIFTTSTDARNFTLGVYGVTWDNTLFEIANEVSVFNKSSADNGDIIGFRTVGLQRGDIRASATSFTISSRTNLIFGSNNTDAMFLFSTGNLLVGTPSPISDNGARLQVSGTGNVTNSTSGNALIVGSTYAGGRNIQIGISDGSILPTASAYINDNTGVGVYIGDNSASTKGLYVKYGGNVGIGTASPNAPLTVQSNGGGLAINLIGRNNAGIDESSILFSDFDSTTRNAAIQGTNSGLTFFYGPLTTLGVRLDGSGNVGIGTASPEALLHVNSANTGGEGGYIYIDNPATSTLNNSVGIRFVTSSGGSFAGVYTGNIANIVTNASDGASALTFGTWNGSTAAERMRITSSGNVGIGTASPNYALHINSSSTSSILQLTNITTGSAANKGMRLFISNNDVILNNREAGYIGFETQDTERMRITSGGSVGINNTSPVNTAWGNETNTKQLSIDATNYAVINLQGSTGRKYSMGVGDGNFYMCYDNTAARHNLVVSSGGNVLINTTTSGSSKLRIIGLPTSSAGLSSGDVWSDSGTLKIA